MKQLSIKQKISKNQINLKLNTMKKVYLVLFTILCTVYTSNAQKLIYGVKGGLNFATVTGDVTGAKSRTSFHLGGVVELPISDKFSIQPELLFSLQGTKAGQSKWNFSYLNIPVMAKFYAADGFSLEGGPQFSLLLSANAEAGNNSQDVSKSIKALDLGVGIGAGYKLDNGFNFSLRYNFGLSNFWDVPGSKESYSNAVFQISAGYSFL